MREGAAHITQQRYTHALAGDVERARHQLEAFINEHDATKFD